jgi:L-seryl-tRNA(Ser) seleniumtransferase
MAVVGAGYSNLEYDLEAGRRGSRYVHAEALLCRLTGAEAAVLVNNNAGAVLLVLSALAAGQRVIVSRGQLVEIGGGFRIPDVMAQSGALLYEVGTTNRTYVHDYTQAVDGNTAGLMRVHSSNFAQTGFVHQPALAELVEAAHARGLLVLDDLGSGTLLDTAAYGLAHEPTVQESVSAGADVVMFSGDKLLGGPQAGIIVGRAELLAVIRRHPLIRALRVDKTTIAGIQANLLHYVRGEAEARIPVWRILATPVEALHGRAERLVGELQAAGVAAEPVAGRSMVGGGSLPEQSLATWLVSVEVDAAERLAARLRGGSTPVVARVQEGRLLLDLRTVLPDQDGQLTQQVRLALQG